MQPAKDQRRVARVVAVAAGVAIGVPLRRVPTSVADLVVGTDRRCESGTGAECAFELLPAAIHLLVTFGLVFIGTAAVLAGVGVGLVALGRFRLRADPQMPPVGPLPRNHARGFFELAGGTALLTAAVGAALVIVGGLAT
ncbi:MAG: hypothetical protein ACR2O6_16115 [Ilumatobacteraceae bacterium]